MMGEFDLITRYFKRPASQKQPEGTVTIGRGDVGIGDDCAVWTPTPNTQLCISSDMLVEGRHFLSTVSPEALGHKALAVNLSDLAACGATPRAFTLALALPSVDEAWLEGFSRGLFALADLHNCTLIGGDTTQGPLNICITVLGEVPQGAAILRSGARAGDDIYVSGAAHASGQIERVGQARFALEVFRGNISISQNDFDFDFDFARRRMERPTPRVALGVALRGIATAAIDISDGLLGDLGHILKMSNVGATVQTDWIDDSHPQAVEFALAGGDDYELLLTAPQDQRDAVQAAAKASNTRITCIGQVTAELGLRVLDAARQPLAQTFASFDHFAKSNQAVC
jgi:thiamine-monophosphate kinase